MKRLLLLLALAVIIPMKTISAEDYHNLKSLWSEYRSTVDADRPQKALEVLGRIKKEALARKLKADYYDAACLAFEVGCNLNWKERESLSKVRDADIEMFGDPMMTYHYRRHFKGVDSKEMLEYATKHWKQLEGASSMCFHESRNYNLGNPVNGIVAELSADDWEYVLWDLYPESSEQLEKTLGGEYPSAALLDLVKCTSVWEPDTAALKKYAEDYAGKAVALIAEQKLLDMEFDRMNREGASSGEYKAFRDRCREYVRRHSAFGHKPESVIASHCTMVQNIISTLDASSIVSAKVSDSRLTAVVRNMDKLELEVTGGGKTVDKFVLKNARESYYAEDTLELVLSNYPDGDYKLDLSGKGEGYTMNYSRYRLSLALRNDADGCSAFLAGYRSGEPVDKADLVLIKNGKTICEEKDFAFNGFTRLPSRMAKLMDRKNSYELCCSCTDASGVLLKSRNACVWTRDYVREESVPVSRRGYIFTDCSAFNPGDEVRFKAVLYGEDEDGKRSAVESGSDVQVVLRDPQGKEAGRVSLVTNDFGSVAGSFKLPAGHRNGRYFLQMMSGGQHLAQTDIVVDEYVLPSFDLVMDEIKGLYFVNDVVPVTGRLKAYSGHSIADADVTCVIQSNDGRGGSREEVRKVDVERDGSFRIDVRMLPEMAWCFLNIKVVDATGETREYSRDLHVEDRLSLDVALDGTLEDASLEVGGKDSGYNNPAVLCGDRAVLKFGLSSSGCFHGDGDVDWKLMRDGAVVKSGSCNSADTLSIDMAGQPSGLYVINAETSYETRTGKVLRASSGTSFALVRESDRSFDAEVENLFCCHGGKDIAVRLCATRGPVWAVASLYGSDNKLISSRMVHLHGGRNSETAQTDLKYEFLPSWTDAVELYVLYFRNGRQYRYSKVFTRPADKVEIPLDIIRMTDRSYPSSDCILSFKTSSEVECAVSVFDISTEKIQPNRWHELYGPAPRYPSVSFTACCGMDASNQYYYGLNGRSRILTKSAGGPMVAMSANAMMADAATDDAVYSAVETEEAVPFKLALDNENVDVRSDFAAAIAFEPFLRPDSEGVVDWNFRTSDKLSAFVVQMFLHDRSMNTRTSRRELLVTLPVKVSVMEPRVLYAGDCYTLNASVSAISDTSTVTGNPVERFSGRAVMVVYDGGDYEKCPVLYRSEVPVSVEAGGMTPVSFPLPAVKSGSGTLGLKVMFVNDSDEPGGGFSDAVFVTVPVKEASQTLVEAHSAIVMAGSNEQEILERLRSEFVNTSPYGAALRSISILDMVREAVPRKTAPSSKDVLSLTEALYASLLSASLRDGSSVAGDDAGNGAANGTGADSRYGAGDDALDAVEEKILACRNADGGFGWFQGMKSSPVLTAVVVERLNSLKSRGLYDDGCLMDCLEDAVSYLDDTMFGVERPSWCGGLTLEQYLHVRSTNASVPLDLSSADKKKVTAFRKAARAYLVPSKARGLNGEILRKARRIKTLMNLGSSDEGIAFARTAGIKLRAGARLASSLKADLRSLFEYAVAHKDGGMYYPDAVMPFRGLMESELYAHSLLCDLWRDVAGYDGLSAFAADAANVADGIRLWMMLQKETQQWGDDPAFIEAVSSVLDGSTEVLDTKVLVLEKSYEKPFDGIKAAGNGFTVSRSYFREDGTALRAGEILTVGQKIVAKYEIDNGENRSFVRLNVPRPACLRPVDELSGHYGWWARPLVCGMYSFSPQGYRNVTSCATEYWFDSYPEGKTTLSEEFYVSQTGVFTTPVTEIECLYAPHYRANEAWPGLMTTGPAR